VRGCKAITGTVMVFLVFWIKTAARRFVLLLKESPVIVVGAVLVVAAIAAAKNELVFTLDTQKSIIVLSFFILISALLSLRKYSARNRLIIYSKSGLTNKSVHILFFLRRALVNNLFLLIFWLMILKGILLMEYVNLLPVAAVFSVVLSFFILYIKNESNKKNVIKKDVKVIKLNPFLKSAVFDYLTSDFLSTAVFGIVLFFVILIEYFKNRYSVSVTENYTLFFTGMSAALSIGFMGIIGSIPNINWKFHSIICPEKFSFHLKRTGIFLSIFFVIPALFFVVTAAFHDLLILIKYVYCIAVLFLLSVNISFSISHVLIKGIKLAVAIGLVVWLSNLHFAYLLIMTVPAAITLIKTINEYREWYYL